VSDREDGHGEPAEDAPTFEARVTRIHEELVATEERPIEREAARWIGEAQAVAGDAATGDLPEEVVRERVGHVAELLSHVDGTGDETADERVDRAAALAEAVAATDTERDG
jgi:hypothetical protein